MNTLHKSDIFRNGSTTYYTASLFFPPAIREEVFTLYAYVRVADDYVDSIPAQHQAFHQMVKLTWLAWEGKHVDDEIVRDFVELAKRKKFEKSWVEAFLTSMQQDITQHEYQTIQDLEKYIYGSAEVIGLMMSRLMQLPPEAEESARMQGKAMQFLNFIRDVAEDKALGRVYMPREDLDRFVIGTDDWSADKWSSLLRYELERYFEMQKGAERSYKMIPWRYRIPIQTAAQMYKWTAQKLYAKPDLVWKVKLKPTAYRIVLMYMKLAITNIYAK